MSIHKQLALLLLLHSCAPSFAQSAIACDWKAMESSFEAIVDEDQSGAQMTMALLEKFLQARKDDPERPHSAEEDAHFKEVGAIRKKAGQEHLKVMLPILKSCGWPDYTKLSEKASRAAWLTIQHASKADQDAVEPMIEEAFKVGKIRPAEYALLVDRIRTRNKRPQLYGSQVFTKLSPTGAKNTWGPIDDIDHLDERRASIGLEPICDYLRGFGDLNVSELNPRCTK